MLRTIHDLVALGESGLRELWSRGTGVTPEDLAGWVFRGWNTSLLAARSPVGGRAFAKGFFRHGAGVEGCNFLVRLHQGDWRIDMSRPFGFFAVSPADTSGWTRHGGNGRGKRALLLDYGRGWDQEILERWGVQLEWRLRVVSRLARVLRDLVVRPSNAADGLYVGRAFLTSALKLPVSCFALERWCAMPVWPSAQAEGAA